MTHFLSPVQEAIQELDLIVHSHQSIDEIPNLLNKTVLVGGKRLRPALCFLMGQSLGVSVTTMAPFARAAEFTHSASLAHDDVVDNASTRRNTKTINAESSNKKAVLAGDLLLARVMVELSQYGDVEIIHDLALVVEELVNGEWLQLKLKDRVDVTIHELIEVSKKKTASLMSWCCVVAARNSSKNSQELREECRLFGKNLGIAFQMMDDVIDFNVTGQKDYAKDLKEGLINYVVSDLIQSNFSVRSQIQDILGKKDIEVYPWTEDQLEVSKNNIINLAMDYLKSAKTHLENIKKISPPLDEKSQESFDSLEALLAYFSMRSN